MFTTVFRSLSSRIARGIRHIMIATFRYLWTITCYVWIFLGSGLSFLQRPLAFFIAGYILVSILSLIGYAIIGFLTSIIPSPTLPLATLINYLTPAWFFEKLITMTSKPLLSIVKVIPSSWRIPESLNFTSYFRPGMSPPFSDLADIQTTMFDTLRNNSVSGSGIALDISRLGAIALPALINMLHHTNLTGKEALVDALGAVSEQAPLTSRSIQRFGSAVEEGLAVVLGTNKVAMHRIEAGISVSSSWISRSPAPDVRLFERAIVVFETALDTLNIAAVACNHDLDRLQALLSTVERIVHELHWTESWEREVLLAELWTFVGGNRQRLASYNRNIDRLEEALTFEKRAKQHVVEARFTLDRMSDRIIGLKRNYGRSNILPGDRVALEIQYEILVTSIRQLTAIQARGLEGDEDYYRKIRIN